MMCECNYWAVQPPSNYYYQQPQPQLNLPSYSTYYGYGTYSNVSSSRLQRNQAEKQRRDKLNHLINELALLVPMVSSSAKKLDKTSILRLSATFLRIHQYLVGVHKGEKKMKMTIPMEWCQHLLEGLEGMLLVVTSTGKIVFLSYNVESILGHHQNELLGSSLFDYTHPEDRDELKRNLKSSEEDDAVFIKIGEDFCRPERRSFFLRLKQKAASRSDQPQYELVHVEGHLRTPKQQISQTKIKAESGINANETVLVGLVRPYKERYVMDNSILEATKEEWITRHLIDGTIIFSDHRISYLSGYLSEEVTGNPAFKYMHPDDVRWVMIALRQMYYKSESYGQSCYRLLSKNGVYIHLRTHGFLETDEKGQIKSFICINTLVTPEEGEKAIAEMKKMFTPMVTQRSEPGVSALAEVRTSNGDPGPSSSDSAVGPLKVEDSKELNLAIELLLSDLPPLGIRHESSHPYSMKANTISKTLPPVEIQSRQVGAKLPNLLGRYNRPSVITSVSGTGDRNKRCQENNEEAEVKRLRGNRSVIVSDTRSRHENYAIDTNFIFNTDILDPSNSSLLQFPDDDALRIPVDVTSADLWDTPVSNLEEEVLRRHLNLENRIQSQGVQIQEIEEDLQTIPIADSHVYQNRFTDLKTEHRKQQELLKNLQQDHQRQQTTKEQISLRGTEQDIGV